MAKQKIKSFKEDQLYHHIIDFLKKNKTTEFSKQNIEEYLKDKKFDRTFNHGRRLVKHLNFLIKLGDVTLVSEFFEKPRRYTATSSFLLDKLKEKNKKNQRVYIDE